MTKSILFQLNFGHKDVTVSYVVYMNSNSHGTDRCHSMTTNIHLPQI